MLVQIIFSLFESRNEVLYLRRFQNSVFEFARVNYLSVGDEVIGVVDEILWHL